ncbi:hypothetical protein V8E54_013084 [Elaphomyces granulatus]
MVSKALDSHSLFRVLAKKDDELHAGIITDLSPRQEIKTRRSAVSSMKRRKRSKPMGLLQTAERRTRKRNADLKQASGGGRARLWAEKAAPALIIVTATPVLNAWSPLDKITEPVEAAIRVGRFDGGATTKTPRLVLVLNFYGTTIPVRDSNAEILKAKIDGSLHRHRSLDGITFYPPGVTDPEGNTLHLSLL